MLKIAEWEEGSITAGPTAAYAPNQQARLVVKNSDGQRSKAHLWW